MTNARQVIEKALADHISYHYERGLSKCLCGEWEAHRGGSGVSASESWRAHRAITIYAALADADLLVVAAPISMEEAEQRGFNKAIAALEDDATYLAWLRSKAGPTDDWLTLEAASPTVRFVAYLTAVVAGWTPPPDEGLD